jgi:hypothetical protein
MLLHAVTTACSLATEPPAGGGGRGGAADYGGEDARIFGEGVLTGGLLFGTGGGGDSGDGGDDGGTVCGGPDGDGDGDMQDGGAAGGTWRSGGGAEDDDPEDDDPEDDDPEDEDEDGGPCGSEGAGIAPLALGALSDLSEWLPAPAVLGAVRAFP